MISNGILLKSGDQYLLGHCTHSKYWTVFKGGKEGDDESPKDTAYREFFEETGLDLKKCNIEIFYYREYQTKSGKKVVIYLAEDIKEELKDFKFKCSSMVDNKFPEIDDYIWVTKEKAKELVFPSQVGLFE